MRYLFAEGLVNLLQNAIQADTHILEEVQRRYIRYVMDNVNGNKRMAASILGIARRTLYRWLEE